MDFRPTHSKNLRAVKGRGGGGGELAGRRGPEMAKPPRRDGRDAEIMENLEKYGKSLLLEEVDVQ